MYFTKFPKIQYNILGNIFTFTDITRMVKIDRSRSMPDTITDYTYYTIQDGARPDIISNELYSTPEYYWTFFAINEHLKGNLYYDWPLSYQKFESMITDEYDYCSSITFKPINNIIAEFNNKTYTPNSRNIFENAVLDEKYLQYLEVVAKDSSVTRIDKRDVKSRLDMNMYAKILKYDARMCQLVVYDIRNPGDNDNLLEDRSQFTHHNRFYLRFVNPHAEGTPEYYTVYDIETEWLYKSYVLYKEDCLVIDDLINSGDVTFSEQIAGEIEEVLEFRNDVQNIREHFRRETLENRFFISTNDRNNNQFDYSWDLYRNAAQQYYSIDENQNEYEISAVDQLQIEASTGQLPSSPKYYSYYDLEYSTNEKKSQIKIIRPEKINEFVEMYMSEINE
jgi:hypothetical protein